MSRSTVQTVGRLSLKRRDTGPAINWWIADVQGPAGLTHSRRSRWVNKRGLSLNRETLKEHKIQKYYKTWKPCSCTITHVIEVAGSVQINPNQLLPQLTQLRYAKAEGTHSSCIKSRESRSRNGSCLPKLWYIHGTVTPHPPLIDTDFLL